MAQLPEAFDSAEHDDMGRLPPVPEGAYEVHITKSSLNRTKDKKGHFISFEFTILKGEYKGRKIWTNLNIHNANAITVEIAKKELATICRACGKGDMKLQDTAQLHDTPFLITVAIQPGKGIYPPKNVPKGYEQMGGKVKDGSFDGEADTKSESSDIELPDDADEVWGD